MPGLRISYRGPIDKAHIDAISVDEDGVVEELDCGYSPLSALQIELLEAEVLVNRICASAGLDEQ